MPRIQGSLRDLTMNIPANVAEVIFYSSEPKVVDDVVVLNAPTKALVINGNIDVTLATGLMSMTVVSAGMPWVVIPLLVKEDTRSLNQAVTAAKTYEDTDPNQVLNILDRVNNAIVEARKFSEQASDYATQAYASSAAAEAAAQQAAQTGGVSQETLQQAIAVAIAELPQPVGWVFSGTGEPPRTGTYAEGTFCYTMETGYVYRWENNRWVYKEFTATTVKDQQIAHQILNGPKTKAALSELMGVEIPYSNDYSQPRVQFSGRDWVVRDSSWKNGGPTANDEWAFSNVREISGGKLELHLTNDGGTPYGAEIISVQSMGYGTYELAFSADFAQFDKYAAFGFFTFDWEDQVPGHQEIDAVEISKWGKDHLAAKLTHYPDNDPVHQPDYRWDVSIKQGVARMVWEPGRITWALIDGKTKQVLHTATTTERVPTPQKQQVHINLWTFNATGWQSVAPQKVTLDNFSYTRIFHASPISDGAQKTSVSALDKYFDATKRYLAPVTYWWADHHWNANTNWRVVFDNIDLVPFILVNPSSGPGSEAADDFKVLLRAINRYRRPACGYIRTVTDLASRTMRPTEDIKNDLRKYKEHYGELITGVFYDEAANGWAEPSTSQIQIYKELYDWTKKEFGDDFLVIMNPGSPTTEPLLACADVLMTFEQSPERYLSDHENLVPDWYKNQPSYRFWHTVHNIESEDQARKVLAKAEKTNVSHIYLTDDTFSGVLGSENQDNNPWDNLPAP